MYIPVHKHNTRSRSKISFPLNRLPPELRYMVWSFAITGCIEDWPPNLEPIEREGWRAILYRIHQMQSFLRISHVCHEAQQVYHRTSQLVHMVLRSGLVTTLRLPSHARVSHVCAHKGLFHGGYLTLTSRREVIDPRAPENNLIYGLVDCQEALYGNWPLAFNASALSTISKALPSLRYLSLRGARHEEDLQDVITKPINVKPWK